MRSFASRLVPRLIHLGARLTRPLTMGVRVVVLDEAGRVFLVRHTYVPGWHPPGGGVEVGETAEAAAVRETREEARIEAEERPGLHGLFLNRRRDHVAVYVLRRFRVLAEGGSDWEIAERGFFAPTALPEGTTAATRARLAEVVDGAEPPQTW